MSLKNIQIRAISDKVTGRTSIFAVINNEFWTTSERLDQICAAPAGTVLVADTKDADGELKAEKSMVSLPGGKEIGFVKDGKVVGKLSKEFCADLAASLAEPLPTAKIADNDRAKSDMSLFAANNQ